MRVLLHTCCAPCLIYPLERLKEKGFTVRGFFYNPNIHPLAEYKNRKKAVEDFTRPGGLEVIYPAYNPEEFFHAVNFKEARPQRCILCWSLRLAATAGLAKKEGCTHFSTTLLVSPYQDQEALKKIGRDISQEEGVSFYYEDWRCGFKKAHELALKQGIYCQKYCGCIYSEMERYGYRRNR